MKNQKRSGNGALIFLSVMILAGLIAIILGFCTDWYRDWTRFGVQGEQQQEEQLSDEDADEASGGGSTKMPNIDADVSNEITQSQLQ